MRGTSGTRGWIVCLRPTKARRAGANGSGGIQVGGVRGFPSPSIASLGWLLPVGGEIKEGGKRAHVLGSFMFSRIGIVLLLLLCPCCPRGSLTRPAWVRKAFVVENGGGAPGAVCRFEVMLKIRASLVDSGIVRVTGIITVRLCQGDSGLEGQGEVGGGCALEPGCWGW